MPSASRFARALTLALLVLAVPALAAAGAEAAPPARSKGDLSVTGTHRGYTNDELYVRLGDDRELTFLVRIPGDRDAKWHDAFQVNERITVTYHREEKEKRPVATAIRKADGKEKP